MNTEKADASANADAMVIRGGDVVSEKAEAHGIYHIECVGPDGVVKWRDTALNVVTTVGKNLALDTYLAGSAYTVVGPYMGLISSTSFSS